MPFAEQMRQALVVAVVLLSVWLSVAHASQGGDALHPVVSLLNTKSLVLPACTKSLPRKEWSVSPTPFPTLYTCVAHSTIHHFARCRRSLDAAAQQKFVNCVLKLQKSGEYDKFAALHYKQAAAIHNSPVFLPWHRWFLRQFELALLKCDATVSLPYWNIAIDAQKPVRPAYLICCTSSLAPSPLRCLLRVARLYSCRNRRRCLAPAPLVVTATAKPSV